MVASNGTFTATSLTSESAATGRGWIVAARGDVFDNNETPAGVFGQSESFYAGVSGLNSNDSGIGSGGYPQIGVGVAGIANKKQGTSTETRRTPATTPREGSMPAVGIWRPRPSAGQSRDDPDDGRVIFGLANANLAIDVDAQHLAACRRATRGGQQDGHRIVPELQLARH